MLARADTNCHNIFNFVSATQTHLAKVEATHRVVADIVRMSDCGLQGIQPCECKEKGYQWFDNQVFRLGCQQR
jgi:predicted Zn-ribbon and HTH transcriptional regulator